MGNILLHLCCGIRDFAAQLDLLPLGADLFVELCKLLINIRFFFCESLPRNTAGIQRGFCFYILLVLSFHAGETFFIKSFAHSE